MSWHAEYFEEIDMAFERKRLEQVDKRISQLNKDILSPRISYSERKYLLQEARELAVQRKDLLKRVQRYD